MIWCYNNVKPAHNWNPLLYLTDYIMVETNLLHWDEEEIDDMYDIYDFLDVDPAQFELMVKTSPFF